MGESNEPIGPAGTPGLLVVAAMREEVAPLIAALSARRWRRRQRLRWAEGRLDGRPATVMWSGVGRRQAQSAARELLPSLAGDREVLIVGVAGALSPSLRLGTLVVARSIHCHGQPPRQPLQPTAECPLQPAKPGEILTIDEIVATPSQRDALWRDLGCPSVAAADMESYYLAHAAQKSARSWSVMRVISDEREERLPEYLPACYDPERGLRRGKVVAWALRRPGSLRDLLALQRRVGRAAESLARAVIDWSRARRGCETEVGSRR